MSTFSQLTFSAVTVVRLLLAVTDWMSESTFGGNADDTAAALVHVRNAFVATVPIDVSFVLFLMSVMTAVLALVVWVELSLREAAIYVAVDFLPLTFVAMVWQPRRSGVSVSPRACSA
jgi:hypothetical protein